MRDLVSVPPRGSGWVRSVRSISDHRLRTHPLPRGGTDSMTLRSVFCKRRFAVYLRNLWLKTSAEEDEF